MTEIDVIPTKRKVTGVRKAAVLLLTLDEDQAAEILRRLGPQQVEEVSREIASLEEIDLPTRKEVFHEFYQLALAAHYISEGGLEHAKSLLSKSLSPEAADRMIKQVTQQVQTHPFSFLQKAESENLLTFIQDEHPQTIALILAHLSPQQSSEVLVGLPAQKQIEVVKRIANMEQTNPEVIKGLEAEDPDLVEQIRRLMFVFEDIMLVNDKGIQSVLKDVDNETMALSLKTASEELKNKIFKNMSDRAAKLIQEDMQYMGPVRVSDVEAAQQKIVDTVRRLEDSGEIVITGRGGEKEMVV